MIKYGSTITLAGSLLAAVFVLCAPVVAETRLALIVTNAQYPAEIGALANTHEDGKLIAGALKEVGFEEKNIAVVRDVDQAALRQAVADFVERIDRAGPDTVAFFYYSGHGAADRSERGENYLIPVGAEITLAKQLPILGVGLSEIVKSLERVRAKARFVVVDACRNVAFTKGLKDAHKGFVPERRLDGIIVAFATRPGEVAEDNNIYATALASILPTPGLEAEQVFKETQRKVAELSRGVQVPWTEDGLLTRFKFKEKAQVAVAVPAPLQSTPAKPPQPQPCDGVEIAVGSAGESRCLKPGAGKTEWFKECPECPEMVVVPAGSFIIGSPAEEPERESQSEGSESPQTLVQIDPPFAVGRFAVTRGEFAAFVTATGHKIDGGCYVYDEKKVMPDRSRRSPGFVQDDDRHPVVCVNWEDAQAYVNWLTTKTGRTYRLLSEAEREYVTRAGTTTPFWWGTAISPRQANYHGDYIYAGGGTKGEFRRRTVRVDGFDANPWGLFNVHGNVWEWTEDCWNEGHTDHPGDGAARTDGDCSRRVLRGGSWGNEPQSLRAACRHGDDGRDNLVGFRVARTL
ncbi:MAG: SUMF1/EgtB/PvdO family nonheme iron enzyme [Hyphomicrobiaceae bacterium]